MNNDFKSTTQLNLNKPQIIKEDIKLEEDDDIQRTPEVINLDEVKANND